MTWGELVANFKVSAQGTRSGGGSAFPLRLGQKSQARLRAQRLGVKTADLGGAAGLDGDDHRVARGRGRNDARALGKERGQLSAGAAARRRAVK